MRRSTYLFLLGAVAAYGCSESGEPLGPTEVTAGQSDGDRVSQPPLIVPQMAMAQEASLGPTYQYTGKSEFADASFFAETENGYRYSYVSLFQERSRGVGQTVLSYDVTECDFEFFTCETTEAGWGTIPSGDVSFGGSSVRVDTDTSFDANPEFFRYMGEGGPIDVTWTKTPFYSTQRVSNERSQYGSIKVRFHDNSTYSSAMAAGGIVSEEFVGEGTFGSSQTSQIEISVGRVVAAASGSGHITVDGEKRTFSFHALQTSDGRVGGEWQRFNRAQDARAHGKVTCMSVNGSTAWLGGFSTKSTTEPGTVRWRVHDGQQGGQDAVSLQSVSPGGDTEGYCWGQPDGPELFPVEAGNINIRP